MRTLVISAALLLGVASPAFAYGYVPQRPAAPAVYGMYPYAPSVRAPLNGENAYAMVPQTGQREPYGDSVRSFGPAFTGGGYHAYNAKINAPT